MTNAVIAQTGLVGVGAGVVGVNGLSGVLGSGTTDGEGNGLRGGTVRPAQDKPQALLTSKRNTTDKRAIVVEVLFQLTYYLPVLQGAFSFTHMLTRKAQTNKETYFVSQVIDLTHFEYLLLSATSLFWTRACVPIYNKHKIAQIRGNPYLPWRILVNYGQRDFRKTCQNLVGG